MSCCSGAEFEEDNEAAVDRIESREDDIHDIVHVDRFGIQTYRHTDIQTYKHTDIQTYRHTDIQTYRHTDIQTYRHQ